MRHGTACAEDPCDYCQTRAEEQAADRDAPMSAQESQGRENSYERYAWGDQ